MRGGGSKIEKIMKQKRLADNTRGLITTKQTKPRPGQMIISQLKYLPPIERGAAGPRP